MNKKLLFLMLLTLPYVGIAQAIHTTLNSSKLRETRELKIQLPRNYEENSEKAYPIMVVLDGDYLFEPVAGNVDYYSYWEEVPEMIIVGINQATSRENDAYYDEQRFLPAESGAAFFEFIGMELIPHIESNYRTAPFKVIIGHDLTSNFLNYYLLKEKPLFQGYINLSPDLAPEMAERLASSLERSENKTWYYLATASEDIPELREEILSLDARLKNMNNQNIQYQFDDFQGDTHYTLVGNAIPKAIEQIFKAYRPITVKDYNRILLQTSVSGYDYLVEKYESIEDLFGIEKRIRVNDFMAVYNAMEKTRNWDALKDLAKLASKHYPKTMLATFFDARYEEEVGNPKRAMKNYQNAYGLQPIAFLTVDYMLKKAEDIKKENGL